MTPNKRYLAAEIFFNRKGLVVYDSIFNMKSEIDKDLGTEYRWAKNDKNAIICLEREVDCNDKSQWDEYCNWLIDKTYHLKEIVEKYLLKATED